MNSEKNFLKVLLEDKICNEKLGEKEIVSILENDYYKKNINIIFNRIFND